MGLGGGPGSAHLMIAQVGGAVKAVAMSSRVQGPVKVVRKPDLLPRDGEFFELAGLQG